jgi:hypothetical protein
MLLRLVSLSKSLLLIGTFTTSTVKAQNNLKKTPVSRDIETELVSIAEAALRVEYDVQVNGDEDGAKRRNPKVARVRDAKFQRRLEKAKEIKGFLKGRKVGFKNFQTKLDIRDIKVEGSTAILDAVEDTARYYDLSIMAGNSPEKSQELIEHRFTFNLKGNQWELVSDEILNAPGSIQGTSKEKAPNLPVDPSIIPSDPLAPPTNNQSKLTSTLIASAKINQFGLFGSSSSTNDMYGKPDKTPILVAQASLNRQAIIQYIYYYALTPNKQYRDYSQQGNRGGDCTNFVSQAMKAGGWPSEQGFYRDATNWWYDFSGIWPGESWTWINADYFFNFISKRPRVKTIGRVADLVPGDVISVDLNPQNNDGIDHTMLVSKKANDGTIYLAYHTSNTLDKTFYEFYNQSPGAKFYAWSLLPSYY